MGLKRIPFLASAKGQESWIIPLETLGQVFNVLLVGPYATNPHLRLWHEKTMRRQHPTQSQSITMIWKLRVLDRNQNHPSLQHLTLTRHP
jgi:hypothetical protein